MTTFVKDHSGILAFSTFLPTIIEEGMATVKGNKLAKQFLDPDLAKKVAQSNRYGFLSYVGVAAAVGLASFVGKIVKDAIAKTKVEKTEEAQKAQA